MDSFDNLPTSDEEEEMPSQQAAVMKKYFGNSSDDSDESSDSPWRDVSKWKIIGMASVAFLALANPWAQSLLSHAPYFGRSDMSIMTLSLLLFIMLMVAIVMFAC